MYFFYFFPLGLDRRLSCRPVLSWTLMVLMTVTFLWMKYFPEALAFDPWQLVFYAGDGAPWTVTTAIFVHASWFHLLGNLIYFYVFAPPLEDRLGPWKFGLYFLLLGNFGNLIHGVVSALDLLGQGGMGVMGASGAIAGMLSFSLVRFYDAKVEVAWWVLAPLAGQNKAGKTRIPLAAAVGLWLLLQLVYTLISNETGAQVSFGAHLGGFAMGLVMAMVLGGWHDGRSEAAQARARRYFEAGHYHAAVGAWCEYKVLAPEDWNARLEMARAMKLTGQVKESSTVYRACFVHQMKVGHIDVALRIHDEAQRAGVDLELKPDQLNQVALFKEKQLDYHGALHAYRCLFESFPEHPQGQRALVRVIVLYHGKVADPAAAKHWLEQAWHRLPPGTWRSFLESEFSLPTELCAGPPSNPR